MQNWFKIAAWTMALPAVLAVVSSTGAVAQTQDDFPFSIMQPEPGTRRAPPPKRVKAPPPAQTRPAQARPAQPNPKAAQRPVRRGSSTVSTIPTFRSPLTPLGTVQQMPTAPSMANPGSPAAPVTGVTVPGGGTAMTPPRPAGQGFQDRASNCISGSTGVGPGQVGGFTSACVNR